MKTFSKVSKCPRHMQCIPRRVKLLLSYPVAVCQRGFTDAHVKGITAVTYHCNITSPHPSGPPRTELPFILKSEFPVVCTAVRGAFTIPRSDTGTRTGCRHGGSSSSFQEPFDMRLVILLNRVVVPAIGASAVWQPAHPGGGCHGA